MQWGIGECWEGAGSVHILLSGQCSFSGTADVKRLLRGVCAISSSIRHLFASCDVQHCSDPARYARLLAPLHPLSLPQLLPLQSHQHADSDRSRVAQLLHTQPVPAHQVHLPLLGGGAAPRPPRHHAH